MRLLYLNPSRLLPKSEHWPSRQRSESTRLMKSMPKLPRVVSQLRGRQFGLRLPMKRLMSCPTVSWNMSPGVKALYPWRNKVVPLMKPLVL